MFWVSAKAQPPPTPLERWINSNQALKGAYLTLQQARSTANAHLQRDYEPWQMVLLGMLLALVLVKVWGIISRAHRTFVDKGWKQLLAGLVSDLPGVRTVVAQRQAAGISKLRSSLQKNRDSPSDAILVLPKEGISAAQIKARLVRKARDDVRFTEGASKVSGAVYLSGSSHQLLLNEVYKQFSITNPM